MKDFPRIKIDKRKKIICTLLITAILIFLIVGIRKPGYYLIDETGKIINPHNPFYFEISEFSDEGYAEGLGINSRSLINTKGEIVYGPDDCHVGRNFGEDGFLKTYKGFYDKDFKLAIEIKYKEGDYPCVDYGEAPKSFSKNGLAAVQVRRHLEGYYGLVSLWGYVDRSGEFVIDPQYAEAYDFADNGYALVENMDRTYEYIDEKGNAVSKKYYDASSFGTDNIALVCEEKEGKSGYINEKFEYVIEPQYDLAGTFEDSELAWVSRSKGDGFEWGFINKKGELVIDYQFSGVAYGFKNGYCVVAKLVDGYNRWGFIDENGNYTIEPQFSRRPNSFSEDGIALVQGKNGLYGYIRSDGTWLLKPQFEKASDFSKGYAAVWLSKYQILKK